MPNVVTMHIWIMAF